MVVKGLVYVAYDIIEPLKTWCTIPLGVVYRRIVLHIPDLKEAKTTIMLSFKKDPNWAALTGFFCFGCSSSIEW